MTVYPSSRMQAERTIAAGRIALAAASLLAIWLDPAEPARYAQATYGLHWIYVTYAVLLALGTWRWEEGTRLPAVTHVIDIIVFSVFQYLTLGASSPLFMYFMFSTFCGAIRWGSRGTLVTGGVVISMYLIMTLAASRAFGNAPDELNRIIIRTVYLAVTTGMLVYLSRYEARLRSGIERLAGWPVLAGKGMERALPEVLKHTCGMLNAKRALVVWEVEEEPGVHLASWSSSGFTIARQSTNEILPLLPADLEDKIIVCAAAIEPAAVVLVSQSDGTLVERQGFPLSAGILELLTGEGLTTGAFEADTVRGRVFFSGMGSPTAEIVPLTEVVSKSIGWSIEQIQMTGRLQAIGASEERLRLARDLHDGLLQSLTGVRFELRALQQSVAAGDESVAGRLQALERALTMEQRELRQFINGLKPARTSGRDHVESTLATRLDDLGQRIALEWKTPVSIRVSPDAGPSSPEVAQAVPLMVHEAVVNAMKHARPTRVAVNVEQTNGHLRIVVRDDGCGFEFTGRRDHEALNQSTRAPRSLYDRVTALGGQMSIDSSPEGSQVEMLL